MPNSVLWVCLVAVWLFVLVPMVIKGKPEVKKSTDAAGATRVVHRGGTRARTRGRRAARVSSRTTTSRTTTSVLDDDDQDDDAVSSTAVSADAEVEDGSEAPTTSVAADDDHDEIVDADATGDLDDAADLDDDAGADPDLADDVAEAADTTTRPATTRSTRTGGSARPSVYAIEGPGDPLRYKERQRVTAGLFVLLVGAIVAGALWGRNGWIATGVAGALFVGYMIYLRRTVRNEQRVRAQRLARARRSARAEAERREQEERTPTFEPAAPAPTLRRPGGATVVEIDDESPVFDHLPPFQRRRVMREDEDYRSAQAG
ncbi:MAG: hypothetical protein QM662_13755 [Gordonia sp. (in: high G+C Gram-positive bacteria)]